MKRLISAETVREEHRQGKRSLEIVIPACIVTPEARNVAQELGMELIEQLACEAKPASHPVAPVPASVCASDSDIAKIRAAVMAKLPAGSVPGAVVDQLVKKIVGEQKCSVKSADTASAGQLPADWSYQSKTISGGIKCIAGSSVKCGLFEGAGVAKQVGIADIVNAEDGSSMAAGFMEWQQCFFPWTLTYDEVDLVMEGELHIRCNGETVVGKAGDVIFIPKNSSIEFGTPSNVRFLYVAYPSNWQS